MRSRADPPTNFPSVEWWSKHTRQDGECLVWTGASSKGYGQAGLEGRTWRIHRLSYVLFVGALDPALEIDHLCRNTLCVNPEHLEQVTTRTNLLRGDGPSGKSARQTHCIHGHPFSGDNLYIHDGARHCRVCRREAMQRFGPQDHRRWVTCPDCGEQRRVTTNGVPCRRCASKKRTRDEMGRLT
jgi:hypothetical protein